MGLILSHLTILNLTAFSIFISLIPIQTNAAEIDLKPILFKAADYCEKLENAALNFVCSEHFQEEIYGPKRTIENELNPRIQLLGKKSFLIDYQLISDGETIQERRTLIEEDGKSKKISNFEMNNRRFYSMKSVYGPISILGKQWLNFYKYRLLKKEVVEGRPTYVIECEPREEISGKPNYGKFWIDVEDFSILRMEVKDSSLAGYEAIYDAAVKDGFKPIIRTVHEYGVIKEGVRYPSKTTYEEIWSSRWKRSEYFDGNNVRSYLKSKTVIDYKEYRFFQTETEPDYAQTQVEQ